MKHFRTIIGLGTMLVSCPDALSQQVEFSGYGAVGYRILDREALNDQNQEGYFEGKLQADIRVNRDIEAQLDFRGNSNDKSVELREFTAKIELADWINLKLGNPRKPFGSEQMVTRSELETVDRSFVNRSIAQQGYGGRSIALMLYDKYKEKDTGMIPISYHLMFFRDNSLNSGVTTRFSYHLTEEVSVSAGGQFQNMGGRDPISTFGATIDVQYDGDDITAGVEGVLVNDPLESIRLRQSGEEVVVSAIGAKLNGAMELKLGDGLFRSIEPVVLLGLYVPDSREPSARTVQLLGGLNLYLHKRARMRVNVDLLDTRSPFSTVSSTHDSRVTLEFQVRY